MNKKIKNKINTHNQTKKAKYWRKEKVFIKNHSISILIPRPKKGIFGKLRENPAKENKKRWCTSRYHNFLRIKQKRVLANIKIMQLKVWYFQISEIVLN